MSTASANTSTPQPDNAQRRIAIIKADDMWGRSALWDEFFRISEERGVKVSVGIVCNSLESNDDNSADKQAYFDWLRQHDNSGQVEFWHHGWDHKRWQDGDVTRSEYGGSGYAHQKENTVKAQQAATAVLGKPFNTLGTPFNAMDADSARVFNEQPEIEMIFCYPSASVIPLFQNKVLLSMTIKGEHDGTGLPNFEKFKEEYEAKKERLTFAALQVHPPHFKEGRMEEYAKILDYLNAEGWEFMLPSEYLAYVKSGKAAATPAARN